MRGRAFDSDEDVDFIYVSIHVERRSCEDGMLTVIILAKELGKRTSQRKSRCMLTETYIHVLFFLVNRSGILSFTNSLNALLSCPGSESWSTDTLEPPASPSLSPILDAFES